MKCGATFVAPGDVDWPVALADLDTLEPIGLWCRGEQALLAAAAVAVVGSRAATGYGQRIGSDVAAALAQVGTVTVSGGAFGVDAAAHRGALAARGSTIAVLACGVDVSYPASHDSLFEQIAARGAVVSEAAPGSPTRKHLFLTRNRIIAALTTDTVVVEAALRSGALSTANWAAALGRRVWGVPGPITSPASAGVNRALAQGVMTTLADIAQLTQHVAAATSRLPTSGDAATVVAALRAEPATVDELARRLPRMSVAAVQAALVLLELDGRAARDARGWRVVGACNPG
jgi:DNA processing protein